MKAEKTIDWILNSSLRRSLEGYKELESPQIGIFPTENIYQRTPYFLFRFKNPNPNDYKVLENIISNFQGELEWSIVKIKKSKKGNYFIEPKIIMKMRNVNDSTQTLTQERINEILGFKLLEICDKSLIDLKNLSTLIETGLTKARL